VTTAAGILCSDGLVLCADTEHTISDDRKAQSSKTRSWHMGYRFGCGYDGCKIDPPRDVRVSVGLSGAGHSDWIEAFMQGVDQDILADVPDQFDIDVFEKQLRDFNQEFFSTYIRSYAENPQHRPQAYMLVLVQFCFDDTRRAIFHAHENVVLKAEERCFMAVGAGAPVFQGFAEMLYGDRPSCKQVWTMKEAAAIAVYIMDKVKSEVPGCGGNTQIMMIGADSDQDTIPTKRIKELEIYQSALEVQLYGALRDGLVKKLP
jgi:20S proteasome alpha/beta subunit